MQLIRKPFVFMRHGETAMNRDRIICGRTDVPLSALGEQQARSAAPLLRRHWSRVACSDLQRARQTAGLALPDSELQSLSQLNERDWGQLEGAPLARLVPYLSTPPGGEPWMEFEHRVVSALNGLLQQFELPLIVAHSGVYRVIRQQLFGSPEGQRVGNAEPVLIQPVGDDGWTLTLIEDADFEL